eukprot:scaffold75222_cov36-Cyclotella_meneghiniana.AAC.4
MVMLVEGGEFNHSSSGGTAADNVDEGVVMAETCTCDCARTRRISPHTVQRRISIAPPTEENSFPCLRLLAHTASTHPIDDLHQAGQGHPTQVQYVADLDDALLPRQKRHKQESEQKSGEFEFESDATKMIAGQLLKFSDGDRAISPAFGIPVEYYTSNNSQPLYTGLPGRN